MREPQDTCCFTLVTLCRVVVTPPLACSRVVSGCGGNCVGGFSQRDSGEGGAGHAKDGVCFTGASILRFEFDSGHILLECGTIFDPFC